jgi:NAD(P)-dependent dehydrogenase (short-subunit alcohol dehydrogenase family)
MSKTWFVTGASRGLGRAFVDAALGRGDRVVATARYPEALADLVQHGSRLLALPLDVTDGRAAVTAVRAAVDHFGQLDVVVNNAGHGVRGAVEEVSEADFRASMEVNFFGALSVTRAVLPVLRAQGHGHIVQITSMGGLVGLPLAGAYIASKWALEGLSECLTQEVAGLGIVVTVVEPTAFATGQGGGAVGEVRTLPAYQPLRDAQHERAERPAADPADAAEALLRVVDADTPPSGVVFGVGGVEFIHEAYAERLAGWQEASSLFA